MMLPLPLTQDLVLVGGGHAHAILLRMWGMNPLPGVRLTLINPGPSAPYTGMLPGLIAGHYDADEAHIDLVKLARFSGARILFDHVIHIDHEAKELLLGGGRLVGFDIASIDVGVTSELNDLKGFSEFAVGIKPMDKFVTKWNEFRADLAAKSRKPLISVIGGGVGGVEVALAMKHACADHPDAKIEIFESKHALEGQSKRLKESLLKELDKSNISLRENTHVVEVTQNSVVLSNAERIPSDLIVSVAGARPYKWLEQSTLELDRGYIKTLPTLQSVSSPDVFAVGDCANFEHAPRPKAGVFAVRAAPILFANLRAIMTGGRLVNFTPQTDYLKLVSLGGKSAIGEKWGLRIKGTQAWNVKDWIDRRFIDQFHSLKPMSLPKEPDVIANGSDIELGAQPLCGGCGAKVSNQIITDVLSNLPKSTRPDIYSGPGDDAAILAGPDNSKQVMTTDHLRAFCNDPFAMAKIACVHALGDIWAMGADPQAVTLNLTLPPMSKVLQQKTMAEVMNGAASVIEHAGASIVGGHTTMGAEFSIGVTATGLTHNPITVASANVGDLLVLTKPIGTGVILAAEMAMAARGEWVASCLASMAIDQAQNARALAKVANAMTDVTGFGLAGHLLAIAKGSKVGIQLKINAIPFYDGAIELTNSGHRSTLFEANLSQAPHLLDAQDPKTALLFDPQTAGGLLASVSKQDADRLLNSGDVKATIIGQVTAGPAAVERLD